MKNIKNPSIDISKFDIDYKTNINSILINLIKNHKFKLLYKLIKSEKIKDYNIKDNQNNYFIHYLVNYNQLNILKLIYKLIKKDNNIKLRLDILDNDGRSLLYNCIKYNYFEILKLIIKNNLSVGIELINFKDRTGLTPLHYTCIFNNKIIFQYLLKCNANPYLSSKKFNNVFHTALYYKTYYIIKYLILKKYALNFKNINNETLLQTAIKTNAPEDLLILIYNHTIDINNQENISGTTVLHQTIISDNIVMFENIISNTSIDLNLCDYYGNTFLHLLCNIYKPVFFDIIINSNILKSINLSLFNINGEIPLHILLYKDNIDIINSNHIDAIITYSDLNLQDNNGITSLMLLNDKKLITMFYKTLLNKNLNIRIMDNAGNKIILSNDLIHLLTEIRYTSLLKGEDLIEDWEIWCYNNKDLYLKDITKNNILKILLQELNIKHDIKDIKTVSELCKNKIKNDITNDIHNSKFVTSLSNINILDTGEIFEIGFYTGNTLDILSSLVYLYNFYSNIGLKLVLDYPLTINNEVSEYYNYIDIDHSTIPFKNIGIQWLYQKIFYPSYFEYKIINELKVSKFLIIPIYITNSHYAHANVLLWDISKKTIERFEPGGSSYNIINNYNHVLLDKLLENKFKSFDADILYYKPIDFLPPVGFQALEGTEIHNKKLLDPNGFCWVWCAWWIFQRLYNRDSQIKLSDISTELIKIIRLENKSFKEIIRNFSFQIIKSRDSILNKYELDIDSWDNQLYDDNILSKIEKDILDQIN